MKAHLLGFLVFALAGCTAVIKPLRNAASHPGEMSPSGRINPCHGYERDHERCGQALFNAPLVRSIQLGDSLDSVRTLMRHEPESRSAMHTKDGDLVVWRYTTSYDHEQDAVITFLSGKVVRIQEMSWGDEEDKKDE